MHVKKAAIWTTAEFVFIAKMQNRIEDELARRCNRLVIGDTDSFATALWHERYLGTWSKEVEAVSAKRRPDLYLLTDIDIPFVQDGTRDGQQIRTPMHERFLEELEKHRLPYVMLSGPHARRLKKAIHAIDLLLLKPLPGFNSAGKELTAPPF